MKDVVFLHGLESGPFGSKYHALVNAGYSVTSPDFVGDLDIYSRLSTLERIMGDRTGLILVGSSFGGLLSAMYASKYPRSVAGYVLCAPALNLKPKDYTLSCLPERVEVVHGVQDEVVPIEVSEDFCLANGLNLCRVQDGHRLGSSLDTILRKVSKICAP